MTLARTPYARISPADIGQVDRELKKLEQMSAGLYVPKVLVAARSPYAVLATDTMLLCDCTAGAITLTFPLAARVDGMTVQVVKSDTSANAVTLSGTFSGVANPKISVQDGGFTVFAMNGAYHVTAFVPYPIVTGETGVVSFVYPYGDVRRYGATGVAGTDARAAFAAADAAAIAGYGGNTTVHVPAGTHRVASNLSITSMVSFEGGVVKPDNGVTVTLAGPVVAGLSKIIDTSSGGALAFAQGSVLGFYPQWWGAKNDGVTVSADAIIAATNAASSAGSGVVRFPDGQYLWDATKHVDLDVSKVVWRGDSVDILVPSAPSTYVAKLYSTQTYTTEYRQVRTVLSGIRFRGGPQSAPVAGVCLQFGTGAAPALQNVAVRDGHVEGFTTLLDFRDSTWMVTFENVIVRWGAINTPVGAVDFGERMDFIACTVDLLGDQAYKASIAHGDWHFYGCSLDNTKLYVPSGGDAAIYVHGGHMENPQNPATSGYWAEIASDAGVISFRGTHFVFGSPSLGGTYTTPIFKVPDTNTYGGFIFDGIYLPENANFVPETSTHYRTLVEGLGRVQVCNTTGFQIFDAMAIARSLSALGNQGFESGDLTGWVIPPSNSGTVSAQNAIVRTGSVSGFAAQLVATAGQFVALSQRAPIRPCQIAKAVPWVKTATGTGTGTMGVFFNFYAADGTILNASAQSFKSIALGVDWTVQMLFAIAPQGAAYIEFVADVNGGTAGATGYVSDVLVNIL